MNTEHLDKLSEEALKKADEILKRSRKLKKDAAKLLKDIDATNKKYGIKVPKTNNRK